MKQAKILKVGMVVSVPTRQFAPLRQGWNGWLFNAGIVIRFGISKKTGRKLVEIEYPAPNYKQDKKQSQNTITKWFPVGSVFEYNDWNDKRNMEHPRDYWCTGHYTADCEFLIDKGIYKEGE